MRETWSEMFAAIGRRIGWPGALVRKASVTAIAVLGIGLLGVIPVPGLTVHDSSLLGLPNHPVHLGDLGLIPFAVGLVLVDVFDRLGPGRHADRTFGRDRPGRLARIGVAAGIGVACLQAAAVAGYWLWFLPGEIQLLARMIPGRGWQSILIVSSSLVAGVAVHALAAHWIRESGLGEGFSVVLGVGLASRLAPGARKFVEWLQTMNLHRIDIFGVLGNSLAVASVILGTLWFVTRADSWMAEEARVGRRDGPEHGASTPFHIPGAGIVPFLVGTGLLWAFWLSRTLSSTPVATWGRKGLEGASFGGTFTYFLQALLLVVGIAAAAGWWTVRRDADRSTASDESTRTNRWRAYLLSVGFVAALTVLDVYGGTLLRALGVVHVVLGTALAVDLRREWRFWRAFPEGCRVASVHRTSAVGPALERLAENKIPALARGRAVLGLLRWFGAFSAVEIYVPESHHDAAERAVCDVSEGC